MNWEKDITGLDILKKGTFRSLNGAADENIFIGRASKAGFFCFFKVWRDMPYDAVLDYDGVLYRVEVKGSSGNSFNVTRGSRSGEQIKKEVSRTRVLSREDCDFVVGVDSNSGDCYIVPEDVIEVLNTKNLSLNALEDFREKWRLFMHGDNQLSMSQTRDGIGSMKVTELRALAKKVGVVPTSNSIKVKGTRITLTDAREKLIYQIWNEIAHKV